MANAGGKKNSSLKVLRKIGRPGAPILESNRMPVKSGAPFGMTLSKLK